MNKNNGFGAGHNEIMSHPELMGRYHLVLNPDIHFEPGVIDRLYSYMEDNPDVGNVMPKVTYPNGDLQYLCKLLPTPIDWIGRLIIPIKKVKERINYNFEMHFADYNKTMNVPYLSGCFMFLRKSAIAEIGQFDTHIFMYGEDTDFYFIIGADCINDLPTWHKIDELLASCKFIATKRPSYTLDLTTIQQHFKNFNITLLETPELEISSTDIRQRIKKGYSIQYITTEQVQQYIRKEELYL